MNTVTLYRPVGLTELRLIAESGYKAYPPRLHWQPIFYPVLNEAYASQIANEWNTKDEFSGYMGAVTMFKIPEDIFAAYDVQNVGGRLHDELWVPAEELNNINSNIREKIEVINIFFGSEFTMPKEEILSVLLRQFYKPGNK